MSLTTYKNSLRISPLLFEPISSNINLCESCGTHNPITKCFHCSRFICANCITEASVCVWCLNDDNTIESLNNFVKNKCKKTIWFKIDTDSGFIIPVKKRWWWICFY